MVPGCGDAAGRSGLFEGMRLNHAPLRMTELLIAVAVVVGAMILTERAAWRQISRLRASMTVEQLAAFRSADRLRAAVLEVRAEWRRVFDSRSAAGRTGLELAAARARKCIVEQWHGSIFPEEKQLSSEIEAAFEQYFAWLTNALDEASAPPGSDVAQASSALERVLALTDRLAALNEAQAKQFVLEANAALTRLQRFLFVSLIALLAAGAVIVVLAYQRTIAPLRNTLTESRAIIERQEKLASLGVFAAGIAHEIRNPLTAIKVRLFSLKSSHSPGTSEREDTEVIESEIDRLERIVRDFLQFARPSDPVLELMNPAHLLQMTRDLLASGLARRSIELRLEIASDERVLMDADMMKQALINFIQNAADSVEAGGVVALRTRAAREPLNGQMRAVVVLDVVDTGKGIPPEVQKRLFDPFFTTKEKGTGLGLTISARIVEKHGGVIRYETHPGRGTTFSIVLPVAEKDENESQGIAR
jgi:signal transduction histidine kinase